MAIEAAQVAQQVGSLSLLGTGLLLGLRHGIDWDHVAAITDIASTTTTADVADVEGRPCARRTSLGWFDLQALWLSLLYALGHATVVILLGVGALWFTALLPAWVDPLMERVVGLTLVLLGGWVFYSLWQYARGRGEFRLQSRWMVVFAGVRHVLSRLRARMHGHPHHDEPFHVDHYGPRTAYGVGVIHGIGAETGSQVLLIAAIGGAASQGLGAWMLLAFVVGLVLSNTGVALLASTGFISSARARPLYVLLGVLTGLFSLVVGIFFVSGAGEALPDLAGLFSPAQ